MRAMADLVGIGVGPFNLSLAALLEPVAEMKALFLEQRGQFAWHPDQLLPGARLQTSFLKDLVTPVDPTSRHSFLNYLRARRRFYEFLNADQAAILRAEFADYLAWVAGRLGSLRFAWPVEEVTLRGDRLQARRCQRRREHRDDRGRHRQATIPSRMVERGTARALPAQLGCAQRHASLARQARGRDWWRPVGCRAVPGDCPGPVRAGGEGGLD